MCCFVMRIKQKIIHNNLSKIKNGILPTCLLARKLERQLGQRCHMACLGLRGPTWSVPSKYLLLKVARYIYLSWSTTCTLQKRQPCSLCDKLLHLYMSTTAYPDCGSFSLSKKGLQQNTPDANKQDYFRFTTLILYGFGECALTRSPSRLGEGRPSSGRNVHP